MIIFLPQKIKSTGGSSTFALKLQRGLRPQGHQVVFQFISHFDFLLVNAVCPLRYLLWAKLTRRSIIQRLDGVYYPMSVAHYRYWFYNLPLQIILHFFADAVVYQSQYSKDCCDKFLGANRYIPHYLIYNGVDTALFSPHGQSKSLRDFPGQPLLITASRFRRADQILPLLAAFTLYKKQWQPAAKLIVIGDISRHLTKLLRRDRMDPAIHMLGPIANDELPNFLRASDIFLFTHLNPPCPNNIIEAMACGLPICGVSDGAMVELTSPGLNSELIAAPDTGFYHPRQLDLQAFSANLNKIMTHQKSYASHSRRLASLRFSLPDMIANYLTIFNNLTG